jgi:UDP-N-acetylmuramoylalanine--D-glutamate ligase
VAAVLNVTPDHLDRHRTLATYTAAKARIFENQGAGDVAILNADDAGARSLASAVRGDLVWFSRRRELTRGAFVRGGWIVTRLDGPAEPICPLGEIALRGAHNVENALAAATCARVLGVPAGMIREGIAAFRAVAHRIEFVREVDGAAYYNDSKGTNVESTIRALESFAEPVVLIAGGKGKGQDFAPLARAARDCVTLAVLIGEDAPRLAEAFAAEGLAAARAATLGAAVDAARAAARPGDVILLSPACASFDMFDNYEHRGDTFKHLVRDLQPEQGASGPHDPKAAGGSGAKGKPRDFGGLGPASPEASDTKGASLAPPQHQ